MKRKKKKRWKRQWFVFKSKKKKKKFFFWSFKITKKFFFFFERFIGVTAKPFQNRIFLKLPAVFLFFFFSAFPNVWCLSLLFTERWKNKNFLAIQLPNQSVPSTHPPTQKKILFLPPSTSFLSSLPGLNLFFFSGLSLFNKKKKKKKTKTAKK